jgi:hypothetical protein
MTERERILRDVQPKLTVMFGPLGVSLVFVDLRWGVTEEQATSAQVLTICLREIDRSDFFVAMLAERYGWHHEQLEAPSASDRCMIGNIAAAVLHQYTFVYMYQHCSITELEIRHAIGLGTECAGVIPSKMCLVFFREPSATASSASATAASSSQCSKTAEKKLKELKKLILDSGKVEVHHYSSVDTLTDILTEKLTEVIETKFPASLSLPSPHTGKEKTKKQGS